VFAIEFQPRDLPEVRFAISPLLELWQSIRALQCPVASDVHRPWLEATFERTRDLELELLFALQPTDGLSPDFIHPPPTMPLTSLDDELYRVVTTAGTRVRADMDRCYGDDLPPVLEPFLEDPRRAAEELAERLRAYWDLALARHWEHLRTVLEGDVLYRTRNAEGGVSKLFDDLHKSVCFSDHRLEIQTPWDGRLTIHEQGLLLVPSVFIWPNVAMIEQKPWQPTVIYPVRGGALLWGPTAPASEALEALIGSRRAAVLTALDAPRSTTELARLLDVPPASVSQHLSVLHAGGLISRHRLGRVVLYRRSAKGDGLAGKRSPEGSDEGSGLRWTRAG
jgi:DNA-binding transcriptional ArsR family regulator